MSYTYKISDQEETYFLTFQIVGWVDIFTRKIYRDIVIESLNYCLQHKGLKLYAYVIMSNHIHLLIQSETANLSAFIRDFKNFTSRKILDEVDNGIESRRDWLKMVFAYHGKLKTKQNYQVWTHENHAELIYSPQFIVQKVNYIHENPVRSGIVGCAEDYLYSSARNYAGLSSEIEVTLLDLAWLRR
jgi:REP element-mobilizing transposase RayT